MAYTTVKIPMDLAEQIDDLVENLKLGYRSRTDFILECVRQRLLELRNQNIPETQRSEKRRQET